MAIYNGNSSSTGVNATFAMPKLSETDWEKILTNVNFVTFMQGLPVGTKKFNDYTIVTSTNNKQYVNPDTLYFISGEKSFCCGNNIKKYCINQGLFSFSV